MISYVSSRVPCGPLSRNRICIWYVMKSYVSSRVACSPLSRNRRCIWYVMKSYVSSRVPSSPLSSYSRCIWYLMKSYVSSRVPRSPLSSYSRCIWYVMKSYVSSRVPCSPLSRSRCSYLCWWSRNCSIPWRNLKFEKVYGDAIASYLDAFLPRFLGCHMYFFRHVYFLSPGLKWFWWPYLGSGLGIRSVVKVT